MRKDEIIESEIRNPKKGGKIKKNVTACQDIACLKSIKILLNVWGGSVS